MNPNTVAAARIARLVRENAPRPAYTTSTATAAAEKAAREAARDAAYAAAYADEEFCFLCGRCTDHVGEHDAVVEAGMAYYEGSKVHPTATYDVDERIRLEDAEVEAWLAERGIAA